jgi:hypothetical protein
MWAHFGLICGPTRYGLWAATRMHQAHSEPVPEEINEVLKVRPQGGFVKLSRATSPSAKRVHYPGPTCLLGDPLRARDIGPTLESIPHLVAVL